MRLVAPGELRIGDRVVFGWGIAAEVGTVEAVHPPVGERAEYAVTVGMANRDRRTVGLEVWETVAVVAG